jgi:hypothetical protein
VGRKAAITLPVVAALIAGCGSSGASRSDPVVRAAYVTAGVPGYRIAAQMNVNSPLGSVAISMNGVYDRVNRRGQLSAAESFAGKKINLTEIFSGLTFFMPTSAIPQLSKVAGGKPWLKFDMSRMLGAMGLSSLPTGTDPSQYVDYLRAVHASPKRIGSARVRGVATTHYHATIDLSRYADLVPSAQRAAAERGISTLERALGSHSMPVDAWIDHGNLLRRLAFRVPECVDNVRLSTSMTMDLYDYGTQRPASLPAAADAYDITPLLSSTLSAIHFGCPSG